MRYVTLTQLQPRARLLSGPIPVPRSPSLTQSQERPRDPTPAAPATLLLAIGTSIPFCEVSFKRFQPGLGSTFLPGAQFHLVLKKTPGEKRTRGVSQSPTKSSVCHSPLQQNEHQRSRREAWLLPTMACRGGEAIGLLVKPLGHSFSANLVCS